MCLNHTILFCRFCSQHHGPQRVPPPEPPLDLLCVAENIMPRIILRLLQHLRVNTVPSTQRLSAAEALEKYVCSKCWQCYTSAFNIMGAYLHQYFIFQVRRSHHQCRTFSNFIGRFHLVGLSNEICDDKMSHR